MTDWNGFTDLWSDIDELYYHVNRYLLFVNKIVLRKKKLFTFMVTQTLGDC